MGRAQRPEWQAPPVGLAEFHAIVRDYPAAVRYDAELVWEEIRSIIKGAKPPVSRRRFAELAARFKAAQAAQRERNELAEYVVRLGNLEPGAKLDGARGRKTGFRSLQEFAASLRDGATSRRDEQLFLLQAALRLLERQSTRLDQPLLTLREYEGLGHKRAPHFPFDRRDIHRIAEYYQERLEATSRYDEIDQTRAALQYLESHGDHSRYDLVVCDEVQDFTDMQLALLFRLASDPRRTVLTGDPKQIINPSGFRWKEVRARYYERGMQVPEVINLSINFRSVGNIVSLANSLLLLKRSLVGPVSGEITERWTFRGRPPLLVEGLAERELLATVRRGGAGQVVLVRTERGARPPAHGAAERTGVHGGRGQGAGIRRRAAVAFPGGGGVAGHLAPDRRRPGARRGRHATRPPRAEPAVRGGDAGAQHAGDLGRGAGESDLEHRDARRSGIPVRRCNGGRDSVAASVDTRRVAGAGRLLHGARALCGRRRMLPQRPGRGRGGAGARPPAGAEGRSPSRRRAVHPPRARGAGGQGPGTGRRVP